MCTKAVCLYVILGNIINVENIMYILNYKDILYTLNYKNVLKCRMYYMYETTKLY